MTSTIFAYPSAERTGMTGDQTIFAIIGIVVQIGEQPHYDIPDTFALFSGYPMIFQHVFPLSTTITPPLNRARVYTWHIFFRTTVCAVHEIVSVCKRIDLTYDDVKVGHRMPVPPHL